MNRFESYSKLLMGFVALLLAACVAGCGGSTSSVPNVPNVVGAVAPTVISTNPASGVLSVPTNRKIIATFSKAMSAATINTATFTVAASGVLVVPVAVTLDATGKIATFTPPAANFAASTLYTATITTGAKDLAGNAMAANFAWVFKTGATADTTPPTVSSTDPVNAASGVAISSSVYATFSKPMDPTTITATTFTVVASGIPPVSGTVTYAGSTATFKPAANLTASTAYTATITTGVKDLATPANAMAANFIWTFTAGAAAAAGPAPVVLGMSGNYAILTKTGVSTTGATSVIGNVGVSPAARTYLTGWSETYDVTDTWATSALVTGKLYAADLVGGTTSADLGTAVGDMQTAYTDAAGRAAGATELGAGDISGMTLVPGVYKWSSGLLIATGVTLAGGPNDVWIFQIAQNLTVSNGVIVTLSGGALPKNIFWQVAGQTTLGTTSNFKGIILDQTAIVLQTGAVLNGRALAQTAVTLNANPVTQPAP
jgi:hypothetical protein